MIVSPDDPNLVTNLDTLGTVFFPPQELNERGPSLLGSAIRAQNLAGSFLAAEPLTNKVQLGFDPLELEDPSRSFSPDNRYRWIPPGFEMFATEYVEARHPDDVAVVTRRIRREQEDRAKLAEAGFAGFIAQMAAGIADPLIFVPGGAVVKGARGVSIGRSTLRSAGLGASIVGVQESLLHQTQLTRTPEETVFAVTGGALFAGMVGGAVSAFTAKQARQVTTNLNTMLERHNILAMAVDEPEPRVVGTDGDEFIGPQQLTIDPAKVDSLTTLQQVAKEARTKNGEPIPKDAGILGRPLMAMNRFIAPRVQGFLSKNPRMNRFTERLLQSPFVLKKVKAPDAESEARILLQQSRQHLEIIKDLYARYATGDPRATVKLMQRVVGFEKREGKLSIRQFNQEIVKALRGKIAADGTVLEIDVHPIPEVAQAAKLLRQEVFLPFARRAVKLKRLPEEILEPRNQAWLHRIWDTEKLRTGTKLPDGTIEFTEQLKLKDVLAEWETAKAVLEGDGERIARAELRAERMIDQIMSVPENRGGISGNLRRPFMERMIDIPDDRIAPFLSNDLRHIVLSYTRAMSGDLAIGELTGLARAIPAIEGTQRALLKAIREADTLDDAVGRIATRDESITKRFGGKQLRKAYKLGRVKRGRVFQFSENITVGRKELARQVRGTDSDDAALKLLKDRDDRIIDRFSSGDAVLARDEVSDWWSAQIRKAMRGPLREIKQLQKQRTKDLQNISLYTDVVRHIHGIPEDPTALGPRALRGARQFTVMSVGGTIGLSSIPDIGIIAFNFGFRRMFRHALLPFIRDMEKLAPAFDDVRHMRGPSEILTGAREASLFELRDEFSRATGVELGLERMTHAFGFLNFMRPWNATMEQFTAMTAMGFITESAAKFLRGRALKPSEITRLGELGMSEALLRRVGKQFDAHAGRGGGRKRFFAPNTRAWDDEVAVAAMRQAVNKASNLTILKGSPLDRPRIPGFSEDMTKVVTMFLNFAFAANTRLLTRGMQLRDAQVMSGMALMTAVGMLSVYLKEMAKPESRRRMPENMKDWVARGFDQSGMTGFVWDASDMLARMTGGEASLSAVFGDRARYYSPQSGVEAIFGPVAGQAIELTGAVTGFLDLDPDPRDVSQVRRLWPTNNVIGIRRGFDETEDYLRNAVED